MRHRRPHRVPAHLRVPDALRRLLRDETLGDLGERVLVAADDLVDEVEHVPRRRHAVQRCPDVGLGARNAHDGQRELTPLRDSQEARRWDRAIEVDVELDATHYNMVVIRHTSFGAAPVLKSVRKSFYGPARTARPLSSFLRVLPAFRLDWCIVMSGHVKHTDLV